MKRTRSTRGGGRGQGGDADSTAARSRRFSGFFGPSDGPPPVEEQKVEVGLLIRSHWVGPLIGKKGVSIREIRQKSDASMNFGDDDIEVDQSKYHVMSISGTRDQVSRACVAIAEKLGEITQSEDLKLVFLIPSSYCGMFIGKKGANISKMRGEAGPRLWIKLSEDPIQLPGANEVTTCSIFGDKEDTKNAIEQAAITLGDISASLKADMAPKLRPVSYGGGFDRGPVGPASYGGGFRRDSDSLGGGGYMDSFGSGSGYGGREEAGGYGTSSAGRVNGRGGWRSSPGGGYTSVASTGGSGTGGWLSSDSFPARGGWGGGGRN